MRFARAKGSKASNERIPESATSWKEMKQSLVNNQANEKSESQESIKTDLSFFKKSISAEEKKNTKWSTFYDDTYNQDSVNTNKKHKKEKHVKNLQSDNQISEEQCSTVNVNNDAKAKLKHKRKLHENSNEDFEEDTEKKQSKKLKSSKNEQVNNKKQKKEKRVKNLQSDNQFSEEQFTDDSQVKLTHKKKFNKNSNDDFEENTEKDQSKNEQVNNNKKHKKEKRVQNLQSDNQFVEEQHTRDDTNDGSFKSKRKFNNNFEQQPETKQFKKFRKEKDPTEYKRRKPGSEFNKVFINGNEIEIEYIEGFPVKKADARRIKQLKKDMINKGIPRSEINQALKLERRKAEKALAREKKKVCFNCRQSGHILSECTQLMNESSNADQSGTGICYKCGSTEHTHFECKVQRGDNFKFAECFICKEQGHIARQCPDNNRGLYPKGGACKVCGDVTHLKKDCPKYQAEQEQHQILADTINNDNIESLEYETTKSYNKKSQNSRKIIKFQ